MASTATSTNTHSCRKWFGIVWLMVEVNLFSANIYGFPSLFKVLPKYGIYGQYCQSSNLINSTEQDCTDQTIQYQNALTLGIIFLNLPSVFVGICIDAFGSRFIKLIGILFHVFGWLALAFVAPVKYSKRRDYLLFIHTVFVSFSGIIVFLTGLASCNYFSKSRASLAALITGSSVTSAIWYSIFQVLIDNNTITLTQLSYIWMSFGVIIFLSSFLFLDWKFPILNLPYTFDTKLERTSIVTTNETKIKEKWYVQIHQRVGLWQHLTNPLYISVVLFLSILLMPSILLSVTWYPWVFYILNSDKVSADKYTFAYNMSSLSAIVLCPVAGFLLSFRADRSKKRKLLNISIVQTCAWILNIISCIVYMFVATAFIIPALLLNCIGRATIMGGSQAVVSTFFPSQYVGRLIGVMWTAVGAISCIQYGLVKLTEDVPQSWRAWIIVLALILAMTCHLVQIWMMYVQELRRRVPEPTQV